MTLSIVIGGKWSSSWTMKGWLACKLSGLPFTATTLFLSRPDSAAKLAAVSPTGRIPVLDHDGFLLTDTLAIAEYLHELAPESAIWPRDRQARAHARAIAAENHASYAAFRAALPMNLVKRWPIANGVPSNVKLVGRPGVAGEIDRITRSWRETRARHGAGGPYLFGRDFCFADAMQASETSRFVTYSIDMAEDTRAYVDAVMAHPFVAEWVAGAWAEADAIGRDACAAFP